MPNEVTQRIMAGVPKKFWTTLRARQLALYNQAFAMSFGETWGRPEAHSVLPVVRRALFENALRDSACGANLKPWDMPHLGNNYSCVTVKAPGIVITAHFVDGPNQIPQEAESRKQHAALNKYFAYHIDERLLTSPLPEFDNSPVYLFILHGAHFPGLKTENLAIDPITCFLRVAVPAVDCGKYLYNWSFEQLLAEYASAHTSEQRQTLEDNARPKRKVRPDEKRKSENGGR